MEPLYQANAPSDSSDSPNSSKSGRESIAAPGQIKSHTYTLCLVGDSKGFVHGHDENVREIPIQLDSKLVQAACGTDWICLLSESGRAYSCGDNTYGQLGQAHTQYVISPKPLAFPVDKKIVRISCGSSHGGFLLENGSLFMFGSGVYGRLGTGHERVLSTPTPVRMTWQTLIQHQTKSHPKNSSTPSTSRKSSSVVSAEQSAAIAMKDLDQSEDEDVLFTDISCGDRHTLLLGSRSSVPASGRKPVLKNSIITFGDGMNGRLGLGDEHDQWTGALVSSSKSGRYQTAALPSMAAICAGISHSAAISMNGELFTWGNGTDGQLGHSSFESEWVPRQVEFFQNVSIASVRCGGKHTVAISRTGMVYTWGRANEGQLGTGVTAPNASQPQRLALTIDPVSLQQMNAEALTADPIYASKNLSSFQHQQDLRVTIRSIVAKENTNLAMDEQARLFTWGGNSSRQQGIAGHGLEASATGLGPIVPKPMQLWYMDLHETPKPRNSHVRTIREQMTAMALAFPRVALTHVDASERFTLLAFETRALLNNGRTGSTMNRTTQRGFGGASFFGGTQLNLLENQTQTAATTCMNASQSQQDGISSTEVKWHLSLMHPLPQSEIPSKETTYFNFMANYKVFIQPSSPTKDGERRDCNDEDHTIHAGGDNARLKSRDKRCFHSNSHESIDESKNDHHQEGHGAAHHCSCPPSSSAQVVKGFDAWLDSHSSSRKPSPTKPTVSGFRAASRFRRQHRNQELTENADASTTRLSPVASLPAQLDLSLSHPSVQTRENRPVPKPPCLFSRQPKRKSASRRSFPTAITTTRSLPVKPPPMSPPRSPSSHPKRLIHSARPAANSSSTPMTAAPPFVSSNSYRFGFHNMAPMPPMTPIYPELCTVTKPRSPQFSMGSGEHFSLLISKRLTQAKGSRPGPGTYNRNRG